MAHLTLIQLYSYWLCAGVGLLGWDSLAYACGYWAECRAARAMDRLGRWDEVIGKQLDRDCQAILAPVRAR